MGRVLFLGPSLTALGGGVERQNRNLMEALASVFPQGGGPVALLSREGALARPGLLGPALTGLEVVGVVSGTRVARYAELARKAALLSRRERPGLIVCGHLNLLPIALAMNRGRTPVVTVAHGTECYGPRAGLFARRVDRWLAVSAHTAAQLERLGAPTGRIAVLPNAVDVRRFRPGRPRPDVEAALADLPRPRTLTVARLERGKVKGVDVALEALSRPGPAGSYLVVGEGSDRTRLEALARRARIPVRFWGRASEEDLPELFRASDLYLMPSRGEGFGYVFIEALASGLPVVAGRGDGSTEALDGGRLGLLVNPFDPDEVAEGIAAQLTGETPASIRDPQLLSAAVARRFSLDHYPARVQRALAPLGLV